LTANRVAVNVSLINSRGQRQKSFFLVAALFLNEKHWRLYFIFEKKIAKAVVKEGTK